MATLFVRLNPILRLPWAFPTLAVLLSCFWIARYKWSMVWLNIIEEGKKPAHERTYRSLNNNFNTARGVVIRVRKQRFLDWILFQLFFNASKRTPALQTTFRTTASETSLPKVFLSTKHLWKREIMVWNDKK